VVSLNLAHPVQTRPKRTFHTPTDSEWWTELYITALGEWTYYINDDEDCDDVMAPAARCSVARCALYRPHCVAH